MIFQLPNCTPELLLHKIDQVWCFRFQKKQDMPSWLSVELYFLFFALQLILRACTYSENSQKTLKSDKHDLHTNVYRTFLLLWKELK